MSYRAKNNAYGKLASGIGSGDVSMSVQAGQGDRFPVIVSPDYTHVTIEDAAGNREIVKVTARAAASDAMTIERAQEGTVARSFSAGDVVELRMVASLVEDAMGHAAKTSDAHTASAISATPVGSLSGNTVAAQLAELDSEKEPAFAGALPFNRGGTSATSRAGAVAALGIEAAESAITTAANATTDIGAASSSNILLTTTATTITGFAAAAAGVSRKCRVSTGGFSMEHSVTFVLPGAANIATAAGDQFEAYSFGSGWRVRNYTRADGRATVTPALASLAEMEAGTESAERTMSPERVRQSAARQGVQVFPVAASVAANALTLTLNPCAIDFRSSTLNSGAVNRRNMASAATLVVSAGSSLGTTDGVASRLKLLAMDNAGTIELAVCNDALTIDESALISTTAEGGAGNADSASVIYSATARINMPFRLVGIVESTQAAAGTWATALSKVSGAGGLPELKTPPNLFKGAAITATNWPNPIGYSQPWSYGITFTLWNNSTFYLHFNNGVTPADSGGGGGGD